MDTWDDVGSQDWEPVVLKTSTRYFDAGFVAAVCNLRKDMGLDVPTFASRVKMTGTALRDLETGRLPYDTAVEHRVRALLAAAAAAKKVGIR